MTGENVCQKGRTGYDSNVVSTDTVKSSTRDQFKATQEEYKLTPNCKAMCLFLTDGLIIFVAWDHRLIAGPFVKEVSSLVESVFEKDDRHASLQSLWKDRC